jgi:hypothetical protein
MPNQKSKKPYSQKVVLSVKKLFDRLYTDNIRAVKLVPDFLFVDILTLFVTRTFMDVNCVEPGEILNIRFATGNKAVLVGTIAGGVIVYENVHGTLSIAGPKELEDLKLFNPDPYAEPDHLVKVFGMDPSYANLGRRYSRPPVTYNTDLCVGEMLGVF